MLIEPPQDHHIKLTANVLPVAYSYPYGMMMPDRDWSSESSYRFGFNGKELSNDNSYQSNIYDYGFRLYISNLGRFLSNDPLANNFPLFTPYQFSGNTPIWATDLDGAETQIITSDKDKEALKYGEGSVLQTITGGTVYWFHNIETEIGYVGGFGEQYQKGQVFDNYGITEYKFSTYDSYGAPKRDGDGFIMGAAGGAEVGVYIDFESKSYPESIERNAPITFDGGPMDISFMKGAAGVQFGVSAGVGIIRMPIGSIKSLSLTYEEHVKFNRYAEKADGWRIAEKDSKYFIEFYRKDSDGNKKSWVSDIEVSKSKYYVEGTTEIWISNDYKEDSNNE